MKIASLELGELTSPVSDAEPCGPDLEHLGDADYLSFVASAEGILPDSFFKLKRADIDFEGQYQKLARFLAASRDLRLLVILAKLLLLNRDLGGFSACIESMANLLRERWESVHPQVEGGSMDARLAPLHALNDFPLIALALQYQPLLHSKRSGLISYRTYLIATGAASAREGEDVLDAGTIEREFQEADLAGLKEARDQLLRLQSGLAGIRDIALERAGGDAADFTYVEPVVSKMYDWLEGIIVKRDPGAATSAPQAEGELAAGEAAAAEEMGSARPLARGRVGSFEAAAAALAAIADYFGRVEPSSPALPLTRQAQELIGKSLFEVMQILLPAKVETASFQLGPEKALSLPLQRMSTLAAPGELASEGGESSRLPGDPPTLTESPFPRIEDRREAIALLEDVGIFYRAREPSSPIPLLTDRARALAERDFLYLLQQMLPT